MRGRYLLLLERGGWGGGGGEEGEGEEDGRRRERERGRERGSVREREGGGKEGGGVGREERRGGGVGRQGCKTVCIKKMTRRSHFTLATKRTSNQKTIAVVMISCTKLRRQHP